MRAIGYPAPGIPFCDMIKWPDRRHDRYEFNAEDGDRYPDRHQIQYYQYLSHPCQRRNTPLHQGVRMNYPLYQ